MFNFRKKKQTAPDQQVLLQLRDAQNRSLAVPVTLKATDLVTLLAESIQLAKLVTTEKRDLEVIRNEYLLRAQQLQNDHNQIMFALEKLYSERSQMIDGINAHAKQLIDAGQYDAGHAIMNRMMDLLSKESPLEKIINTKKSNF